jgi:hypothetical protein
MISIAVKSELNEAMTTYGYTIINTLVTDIDPDIQVKNAMNRINAADREKTVAEFEAEASRIRIVAKAKAEAESAYKDRVLLIREDCQRVSGKCRCTKQSWYQLSRSICLNCGYTARYLTSYRR